MYFASAVIFEPGSGGPEPPMPGLSRDYPEIFGHYTIGLYIISDFFISLNCLAVN